MPKKPTSVTKKPLPKTEKIEKDLPKKRGRPKKIQPTDVVSLPNGVEEEGPYKVVGPAIVDGTLYLSPEDLLRFELLQSKAVSASQRITITRTEAEKFKLNAEATLKEYQNTIALLVSLAKTTTTELDRYREMLAKVYKIDFAKLTYDDVTGKIFIEGSPVLASDS